MRVPAFLLSLWVIIPVCAQQTKSDFVSTDSLYNVNIKKTKLYGVYIPRDPYDAVEQLMLLTTPESRDPFRKADEETVARKLHFGLGRWMEYNWNFEEGSRLSHYFRKKGIRYTEDMTRCMLILFHRHVCGRPAKLDQLIDETIDKRKKWEMLRNAQNEIIDSFTRPAKG
jgi:hypothetical protein